MLDQNSLLPMYHQVKNELIDMIKSGHFEIGDKIYSENELCQRYPISTITAKRVLNEMALDGYITRHPGRGSFVAKTNPISHVLSSFYSFTDEVRQRGMTPSSRLIRLEKAEPPEEGRRFLKLKKGEKALFIQRQRFANREIITLDHTYIHCEAGERMTSELLATTSLYDILRLGGVIPDRAVESFDAVSLLPADAELMGVKPGEAVLKVVRCTYCNDMPIEYNYRYYVPQKYIYSIKLSVSER